MLLVPVLFLLLFLGQEFKAKTAILSCCNSTTSLTQPLITTADQLFSIARLAKLSPSKATFSDASENVALLGDNLASLAIENNWSAVVINGCVRDVVELQQLNIAVFALNSCPKKSNKNNTGTRSIDLLINNILIKEGYWLYGDQNGILVSSEKLAQ